MRKYWQTPQQMARSMFTHTQILNGHHTIGPKHTPIGISDGKKTHRIFDLRWMASHTSSAASRLKAQGRVLLFARERHETCSFQIHRCQLA
jgi:hypothetical protein